MRRVPVANPTAQGLFVDDRVPHIGDAAEPPILDPRAGNGERHGRLPPGYAVVRMCAAARLRQGSYPSQSPSAAASRPAMRPPIKHSDRLAPDR